MKIITSPHELKKELRNLSASIGFVPTMGALHIGHKSLIEASKNSCDITVVSIFVNPTQFLEGEDLDKYPNKEQADKKICELSGVDFLFYPNAIDIYGDDEVSLNAPNVRGYVLEGYTRAGHFSGVLTVVNKLLNIVRPSKAFFGKKDAQQLMLIETMVDNLFMDVEIVPMETVREDDGLALSSRNIYLNKVERTEALKISGSLKLATKKVMQNSLACDEIEKEMVEFLSPLKCAYLAIVDREFRPINRVEIGNTIILIEVLVGQTRLLDNIWL